MPQMYPAESFPRTPALDRHRTDLNDRERVIGVINV